MIRNRVRRLWWRILIAATYTVVAVMMAISRVVGYLTPAE